MARTSSPWPKTGRRDLRVFGVPVEVDATFLVAAVVIGAGLGGGLSTLVVFVAVLFLAVLWHELGHALAFRAYGFSPRISVHGLGGHTFGGDGLTPGRDIVVSLAGPVAGLVLGAAVLATASPVHPADAEGLAEVALSLLAWVNLVLGLFNLVPMLPLDGGRVMANGLELALGRRGLAAGLVVSLTIGVAGVALALAVGAYPVALLVGWYGYGTLRTLEGLRASPPPRGAPTEVDYADWVDYGWASLAEGASTAASNRAREVLADHCTPAPAVRSRAVRLLFWSSLARGDHQEASTLAALPIDPGARLLDGDVVAVTGGRREAVEWLENLFERHPDDATGALLVRSLVEDGRLDEAVSVVDGPHTGSLGHEAHAVVGSALFRSGRHREAAQLAQRSFDREAHPTLAYNIACSWARAGEVDLALTWLSKAIAVGYHDAHQVLTEEDFVAVRRAPRFAEIERQLAVAGETSGTTGSVDRSAHS